jgi:hypothetical protein
MTDDPRTRAQIRFDEDLRLRPASVAALLGASVVLCAGIIATFLVARGDPHQTTYGAVSLAGFALSMVGLVLVKRREEREAFSIKVRRTFWIAFVVFYAALLLLSVHALYSSRSLHSMGSALMVFTMTLLLGPRILRVVRNIEDASHPER